MVVVIILPMVFVLLHSIKKARNRKNNLIIKYQNDPMKPQSKEKKTATKNVRD